MPEKKIKGRISSDNMFKKQPVSEATSLNVELHEDCQECIDLRMDVSKHIMAGLLAGSWTNPPEELAKYAVECADALIKKVKESEK